MASQKSNEDSLHGFEADSKVGSARQRERGGGEPRHPLPDVRPVEPPRSAKTIAELYRARWEVETFFKELKQTCQTHDFIGYSENAVKWQVWAGLIAHLLLRITRHLAKWKNSFSRLAGIVRGCLWLKKDLFSLLDTYGTAGGWVFRRKSARPAWIQALLPIANAPNGTP